MIVIVFKQVLQSCFNCLGPSNIHIHDLVVKVVTMMKKMMMSMITEVESSRINRITKSQTQLSI